MSEQLNPFVSIWTKPRETIRQVVQSESPMSNVMLIVIVAGMAQALSSASDSKLGDMWGVGGILAFAIIVGAIAGPIGLFVSSFLIKITTKWLGGEATGDQLRVALGWSQLPLAITLGLWLLLVVMTGNVFFVTEADLTNLGMGDALLMMIIGIGMMITAIWSLILSSYCIAEVAGLSAWRGFLSILLCIVLVIAIALVIGVVGGVLVAILM